MSCGNCRCADCRAEDDPFYGPAEPPTLGPPTYYTWATRERIQSIERALFAPFPPLTDKVQKIGGLFSCKDADNTSKL